MVDYKELENNFERHVAGKNDAISGREFARYEWATQNVKGKKVLDVGCSSGYGLKCLQRVLGLDYYGIDKDEKIIEFAKKEFNANFRCIDVDSFLELCDDIDVKFDTIIAFEVIEHLETGLKLVEELKSFCDCLMISVPYNEEKGFWGEHHKLHGLTEKDFNGFKIEYLTNDGRIQKERPIGQGHLMLLKWTRRPHVLCCVPTKGRYDFHLANCLLSIANQTVKPDRLIIFDDNDNPQDLRQLPLYRYVFSILELNGIIWEVHYGVKKGQHFSHEKSQELAEDLVWRVDDDTFSEPEVLEKLLNTFGLYPIAGAVGGLILTPPIQVNNKFASSKIEDIYWSQNKQWSVGRFDIEPADHLHCSFLYKKGIAHYDLNLSQKAHREETMFTYSLKQSGYGVYINNSAITWHLKAMGGIRSDNKIEDYRHDELIFAEFLRKHQVKPSKTKICMLNGGRGDCVVFLKVLPDLKKKYERIIVATAYRDMFENQGVEIISVADGLNLIGDDNVYSFMLRNDWKKSMYEAFMKMYGLE